MDAAERNPDVYGYSNFDGGGPYGDSNFEDEHFWALSEIATSPYLYTSDRHTLDQKFDNNFWQKHRSSSLSFNETSFLGLFSQSWNEDSLIIFQADEYLADTEKEKLHFPYYSEDYHWGSNSALTNRAIVLGTAYQLTGEDKYRDGVVDLMDYLLGRNPTGYSYITGYGDKPYKNPHHRFWAKSQIGDRPEPPAGVLSGGPNNTNMSDPVAEKLKGKCAAQTCYVDDHGAWTLNEVTINWNAPLFWMAAFLDATEK